MESGGAPRNGGPGTDLAMTRNDDEHPVRMDRRARELAEIHRTSLRYERDRQARERGHPDWDIMMAVQPRRLRDSIVLMDEWLRPTTPADGDVGGWPLVPSFNPIDEDRLPADPEMREARIQALCSLLMRMMTDVLFIRPIDEEASCRFASTVVGWEVAAARGERRRPSLIECDRMLRSIEDRCEGGTHPDGRERLRFGDALREVAAERGRDDPMGSLLVASIADAGDDAARHVLSGAKRAFMWFRNPAISSRVE